MVYHKNFSVWRAEKLGYMYFSRFEDLIITEFGGQDQLFDLLIDIGEKNKPKGRHFGVQLKAFDSKNPTFKLSQSQYKNVSFPAILILFDSKTDKGFYIWIKKPDKQGKLLQFTGEVNMMDLDNKALTRIIKEIKDWYSAKNILLEKV